MSFVLIRQYKTGIEAEQESERLQQEFEGKNHTAIVVPAGLDVEWIETYPNDAFAIIKMFNEGVKSQTQAEKLQKDLMDHGIDTIIMPLNTSVDLMPI